MSGGGWADFDNASWGSGSGAGFGGGGASATASTPPRPSRHHPAIPAAQQMPMEGIGSAHNVVGTTSTPPRRSSSRASSGGRRSGKSLGTKLATFKRSYGQPHYDDGGGGGGGGEYDDDAEYDDGTASVVSGMSAMSSMSVGTRLQRKIGKMKGLGGGGGGGSVSGRTPNKGPSGSNSNSNGGFGDFDDFGGGAAGSATTAPPPGNDGFADFGAAFGASGGGFGHPDAASSDGGGSFGDGHSLASSGTGGAGTGGGGGGGGGNDPFAIVSTPERKRFGFTTASPSPGSAGSAASTRRQHREVAAGGSGNSNSHYGGDGPISSSPRMSKFSFLRNSSRKGNAASAANRMATAPGMPMSATAGTTTTPGGSAAAPTPSGNNASGSATSRGSRARAKSRESMKRTWDHSRKLAALAATPGADGRRPDLGAAPYSPASAYATTPGSAAGTGAGTGAGIGSIGSRTPQTTPQTPQVQLQDSWTPNWGDGDAAATGGSATAAAAAASSATKEDIISQGVAALASGAVNGFDPYGLAAGTSSTTTTVPRASTTTTTKAAAPSATGGRDSNSTPRHSNLHQQQQRHKQGNHISSGGDDPFAFDAAFVDGDDGFSASSGWGQEPQSQASTPTRHTRPSSRSTPAAAAVDDGGRSTKSPHTHRMAAGPSPSRQQQERYPDRPTKGGLDRFIEQQQRQDHTSSSGGGGGAAASSSSRGSLLAVSEAGRRRAPTTAGVRGADDDTASIVSGTSAYSNATGTSASAAAARRKMRQSMQQARKATGRSQSVLSEGDDGTATTAQSTATTSGSVGGKIGGSSQGWTDGRSRDRAGSSGAPSASSRPPISPSSAKTMFVDDHSAGGHTAGSDDFNSFDAFGLNAKDIDKEVGAALNDLVGSNPDLGFFLDRNRSMSQSSVGGGSASVRSSAVGAASTGSSTEAALRDTRSPSGDAVGPLPFHSPVVLGDHNSETSSVTCSSQGHAQGGSNAHQQPRANQFKEAAMANGHPRRIVRPGQAADGKSPIPPRHTGGSVQDRMNGLHSGLHSPELDHAVPTANNSNNKYAGRNPAERLRKDIQRRKQQHPSSVSDVGASTSGSQPEFNAVLDKMKQKRQFSGDKDTYDSTNHADEESRQGSHQEPQHLVNLRSVPKDSLPSRDAMSDVGGASSGNLFLDSVKLRKTGAHLDVQDEATAETARETPSTFNTEATDGSRSFFEGDGQFDVEEHPQQRIQPIISPKSAGSAPQKKMSYRERREIELREQAELELQRAAAEEAQKESQVDVAELVRRRVAANRQMDSFPRDDTAHNDPVSPDDALKDVRSRLRSSKSATSGPSPPENALADIRSKLKKVSVNDSPSPAVPQFSPSTRAAADASPSIRAEMEAEATATGEGRPQLSVAALMSQRAKVLAEPGPRPESEAEPELPQISVASLMAQRMAAMTSHRPERSETTSPTPSGDQAPVISDEGKNKLSALFASRSALMPGKKPPPADGNGAKEVIKKTNKSKSVAAAASVASLIGKRAGASSGAASAPPSSDGRPALKDDPKFAKYFKMLKMGLPMPAVKHAMTRDGFDPDVMDGDHSKPVAGGGVPLKEDPKYSKYFKMLKMGLPMDAVKHAMVRDGLDESVMDGDHNAPVPSESVATTKSRSRGLKKDTHRRTRLHWGAMDEVNSNSVWALVDGDRDVEGLDIDEEEFAQLFQEEIVKGEPKKNGTGGSGGQKDAVKVIDPKRANNGGIILARLKMSYDEMAKAVDAIDETAMSAEQMQGILEYIPTAAERKILRKYMTSSRDAASKFASLCECEKFMVAMMTVKHSKAKIKALLFKSQFHACLEDLAKDAVVVEQACEELKNSVRFRKLLGIVLNLGNRLNTAGSSKKSKARGVSLESLLKLSQAKAFDKKTTFLHYVVLVVQRNSEDLLNFKEDIPNVMKADKVHWDQCLSDLEEVEHQLETVRKIALYEARDTLSSKTRKKMKKAAGNEDEDNLPDVEIGLEEEVAALRSTQVGLFTLDAIKKVSALRDKVEWTNKRFGRLCEYLGDTNKNAMPHEVFKIMITFCRDFDRAVSDATKQQKAKERARRKEHQKQLVQQEQEKRRASGGGNPDDGTGAPGADRSGGEQVRSTQKNASVLEKAKLQNPLAMASVLEEIQKKKGSGQDLLRKTAIPSRPPSGQENTSQPHYAYSRAQTSEAAGTTYHRRAAPQALPQDYGPPSKAVASPQRYQQSPQPNYVARSPNVDVRSAVPIASKSPARSTTDTCSTSTATSPHNGTARSASLRNHALRDKVRQRRQRRMAASEQAASAEGPSGSVDWPFPRNEAAK